MFEKIKEKLFGICFHDWELIKEDYLYKILKKNPSLIPNFKWNTSAFSRCTINGYEIYFPEGKYKKYICLKCAKCKDVGNLDFDIQMMIYDAKEKEKKERIEREAQNKTIAIEKERQELAQKIYNEKGCKK